MRRFISLACVVVLPLLVLDAGCGQPAPPAQPAPPPAGLNPDLLASYKPLPESVPAAAGSASAEQVKLGRMLFYEPHLSKSQKISCNSCHDLATFGVDNQPTSDGHKGKLGDRNSPTVFNAAGHVAQFWDGRAADVEAQAKGPVLNPAEMAMPDESRAVAVLASMPEYVDAFARAFPGEKPSITFDNMAKAIGAFERGLMTPSRWDALLKGDRNALSQDEQLGFQTFLNLGCAACHEGTLFGGKSYQRLGVAKAFMRSNDPGRMNVTHAPGDRFVFKVPSLRNVEKTGPYFHDGGTKTLGQAVRDMGEYQLGQKLTDQQVKDITSFLKALTGTVDQEYIKPPVLPKSTSRTPKADERD